MPLICFAFIPSRKLIAAVSATAFLLVATPVLAIRYGANTSADRTSVLAIRSDLTADASVGTAEVVKFPRCLVTAQHVAEAMGTSSYVFAADNVLIGNYITQDVLNTLEDARIARTKNLGVAGDPLVDVSVLWLDNKLDQTVGVDTDRRIQENEYAPFNLGVAQDFGFTPTTYGDSPEAPSLVWLMGYGINNPDDDTGAGRKREGPAYATAYREELHVSNDGVTRGAYFEVEPVSVGGQIGCKGDSGGPLRLGNTLYGVLSVGEGHSTCKSITGNKFTAFNSSPVIPGNYERVLQAIAETCNKTIHFGVSGSGTVTGTMLTSEPRFADNVALNHEISCNPLNPNAIDCSEYIHAPETLNVQAVPDGDWEFFRWDTTVYSCKCDTNPDENVREPATCSIPYAHVGYYTPQSSYDFSGCRAVFVQKSSSSSSSTTSSTSSYSSLNPCVGSSSSASSASSVTSGSSSSAATSFPSSSYSTSSYHSSYSSAMSYAWLMISSSAASSVDPCASSSSSAASSGVSSTPSSGSYSTSSYWYSSAATSSYSTSSAGSYSSGYSSLSW